MNAIIISPYSIPNLSCDRITHSSPKFRVVWSTTSLHPLHWSWISTEEVFQWNFFQANSLQLEIILVQLSQSKAVKTQQTRNCTVYRLPGLSTFHLDILHKQCLSAVRFPSSLSAIGNGERQLCYAAMLLEVTVQAEDFNIALSLRLAHHLSLPRRCSEGWSMLRRSE